MTTYAIPQGTIGFLIVQEENKNVTQQLWTTRKALTYINVNIQVDPDRVKYYGSAAYEKASMAQKLASDGYFVFSSVENATSVYMLAIHRTDVTIS